MTMLRDDILDPRTKQLFERLAKALARYRSGGAGRRTGAVESLNAINAYLREFEAAKKLGLQFPFADLAAALIELEDGIVSELFRTERPAGQKREDLLQRVIRIQAAATMELFMKTGMRSDRAASRVARCLSGVGYRHVRNQSVSAATVRYWREKVRRAVGSRDREDFSSVVKRFEPLIASHPAGLGDILLALLRAIASTRGRLIP